MEPAGRWGMFRKLVVLAVVTAVVATGAPKAHAGPPLRSGTIIGGWFPFAVFLAPGGTPRCDWNVDCIAWLESGCDPALAGRNPAVFASIVNVRKLAGSSKQRLFRTFPKGAGLMWGGVGIEFWNKRCEEVQPDPSVPEVLESSSWHFKIPSGAMWMTVSTVDDTTFDWQLY